MAKGKFITLEGGEGVGKSTQQDLLAGRLRELGLDVVTTREPGGAPGAERIRDLLLETVEEPWEPLTEALLHFAARTEHVAKTIRPALKRGAWVVCDRFADSTMAYQGMAQSVGRDKVQGLYDLTMGNLTPELTLILDVSVDEGLKRAHARDTAQGDSAGRYETFGRAFHARLRDAYQEIAKAEPRRCFVVDASPKPEDVHAAIWQIVSDRLAPEGKKP